MPAHRRFTRSTEETHFPPPSLRDSPGRAWTLLPRDVKRRLAWLSVRAPLPRLRADGDPEARTGTDSARLAGPSAGISRAHHYAARSRRGGGAGAADSRSPAM